MDWIVSHRAQRYSSCTWTSRCAPSSFQFGTCLLWANSNVLDLRYYQSRYSCSWSSWSKSIAKLLPSFLRGWRILDQLQASLKCMNWLQTAASHFGLYPYLHRDWISSNPWCRTLITIARPKCYPRQGLLAQLNRLCNEWLLLSKRLSS